MSLFNFRRFIACFVDSNGDYVGKKVFCRSMGSLGHKKKLLIMMVVHII